MDISPSSQFQPILCSQEKKQLIEQTMKPKAEVIGSVALGILGLGLFAGIGALIYFGTGGHKITGAGKELVFAMAPLTICLPFAGGVAAMVGSVMIPIAAREHRMKRLLESEKDPLAKATLCLAYSKYYTAEQLMTHFYLPFLDGKLNGFDHSKMTMKEFNILLKKRGYDKSKLLSAVMKSEVLKAGELADLRNALLAELGKDCINLEVSNLSFADLKHFPQATKVNTYPENLQRLAIIPPTCENLDIDLINYSVSDSTVSIVSGSTKIKLIEISNVRNLSYLKGIIELFPNVKDYIFHITEVADEATFIAKLKTFFENATKLQLKEITFRFPNTLPFAPSAVGALAYIFEIKKIKASQKTVTFSLR